MKKTICVIGAGPAGMMAAISAKQTAPQSEVILIEKNPVLGRKLRSTGGNRCNVTNNCSREALIENIPGNGRFLYSVFDQFDNTDIVAFFQANDCPLKEEAHGRMFPTTNRSQTIIETLEKKLRQLHVNIQLNTTVESIDWEKKRLYTESAAHPFDAVIITCGGICAKHSGSTGDGFSFAKSLGHTVTPLFATEVPLVANDPYILDASLQGISLQDISLTAWNEKNKKIKTINYDIVFTHFGISGPAALRLSSFIQKQLRKHDQPVHVTLDCVPDLANDTLLQAQKAYAEKQIDTWLKQYMPIRLAQQIVSMANLPADMKVNQLSALQTSELLKLIKFFPLTITQTQGMERAFVTGGGVSIKEVQPKTMESKLVPGLYFAGEVLDIYAFTGGFNITAALCTGFVAGLHAATQ